MNTLRRFSLQSVLVMMVLLPSAASAQKFGFSAGAGVSFPMQEFADHYSAGLTSRVTGEYMIMGSISITLSTGYSVWPIKEGIGEQLLKDAGLPGSLSLDGQIRNVPVYVGVRYYSLGSYGHSFLGLSTGTNIMKGTADAVYDFQNGTTPVSLSAQDAWSSTGFMIEAGSSFSLSDSWSILLDISYGSILDLRHEIIPRSQGIPVTASPPQTRTIGVMLGIQYR